MASTRKRTIAVIAALGLSGAISAGAVALAVSGHPSKPDAGVTVSTSSSEEGTPDHGSGDFLTDNHTTGPADDDGTPDQGPGDAQGEDDNSGPGENSGPGNDLDDDSAENDHSGPGSGND